MYPMQTANPFDLLRREMDDVFYNTLRNWPARAGARTYPALNVWEDESAIYVEAEVPGLKQDQLEVVVLGSEITIKGRLGGNQQEGVLVHRKEIFWNYQLPFRHPAAHVTVRQLRALGTQKFRGSSKSLTIPTDTIDQIRSRITLSEVIAESGVELKRSGRSLVGRCPFHSEKTGSFFVNDDEGFYHCFGCGKHGSVFNFVMETRGFSFPETVKLLAQRVGITINETKLSPQEEKKRSETRVLKEILRSAVEIFQSALADPALGEPGRRYLERRGISAETARTFALGYAPNTWHFLPPRLRERLKERGLGEFGGEELEFRLASLGLAKLKSSDADTDLGATADKERFFDLFRGRLIFPISKSDGSAVAIGGRILQDAPNTPKYLNSSESLLYHKRQTFYGISQALEALRREREAFVVEGYLDVISLHQAGIKNVVATCGTALTADHVGVLKRLVDRATIVFDGDAAGQKAAAASFEVFLGSGLDPAVIVLPADEDPDSLARKHPLEKLREIFQSSRRSLLDVYIDWQFRDLGAADAATAGPAVAGKVAQRFAQCLNKGLNKVPNPVEREVLIQSAARKIGVTSQALLQLAARGAHPAAAEPPARAQSEAGSDYSLRPAKQPPRSAQTAPKRSVNSNARRLMQRQAPASKLDAFGRQLVVAILCQPELAKQVLDMPSIMGSKVLSDLSSNVGEFVMEMAQGGLPGLSDVHSDPAALRLRVSRLEQLLTKHGLEARQLLEEALAQSSMGADPQSVVAQAGVNAARNSLLDQVQTIRIMETTEADDLRKEQLIQEKLLKRRNLEKLRSES